MGQEIRCGIENSSGVLGSEAKPVRPTIILPASDIGAMQVQDPWPPDPAHVWREPPRVEMNHIGLHSLQRKRPVPENRAGTERGMLKRAGPGFPVVPGYVRGTPAQTSFIGIVHKVSAYARCVMYMQRLYPVF